MIKLFYSRQIIKPYLEVVAQTCSVKKVFLEISQNSQENTCARVSFLIKLQAALATLLKNSLWHRCFSVNFAKFVRAPFLTEQVRWLLLAAILLTITVVNIFLRTPFLQNTFGGCFCLLNVHDYQANICTWVPSES